MTRDDIANMWEKANGWSIEGWPKTIDEIEHFAALVAAAEREACAQIAHNTYEGFGVDAQGVDFVKQRIAIAIRERGAP
jgi:hypothetical protein